MVWPNVVVFFVIAGGEGGAKVISKQRGAHYDITALYVPSKEIPLARTCMRKQQKKLPEVWQWRDA